MRIYIYHLRFLVVGGGHIFVSDISVLRKGIKSVIEIYRFREKTATAGMIKLRLQALLDILALEHLDYLFSLDDIAVRSVCAETVYRLIPIIVSYIKRPHYRVMIHAFLGRLNTTGAAIGTMKNTSYPKNKTMELASSVLTAAHRSLDLVFNIVIAVSDILVRCLVR